MIAEVIVDIAHSNVDKVFDYTIPPDLKIWEGVRVVVPFGNQKIEGFVIRIKQHSSLDNSKLKPILSRLEDYSVLPKECLELMFYMAEEFHLKLIDAIRLFIPAEMRKGRIKELKKNYVRINRDFLVQNCLENADFEKNPQLTESFIKKHSQAQQEVFMYLWRNDEASLTWLNENFSASAIRNLIARNIFLSVQNTFLRKPYKLITEQNQKKIILNQAQSDAVDKICSFNKTFLLHGVTGSGKTEVYMHAIERMRKIGKTAIMLVPEISLTPQVLKLFRDRFGDDVAILHSGLSAGERFDEWHRLLLGEANIVVGARSAVFAPLQNLGIIIIDEEHDSSYISERHPRYDTVEVAAFRQSYNGASLVLGSATPSISSFNRAERGVYELLELKERVNARPLPEIKLVDMKKEILRGNSSVFSQELATRLGECLKRGEQAMLFVNRRGFASYVLCRSCGYVAKCEDCDVSLVYHREDNLLKCHYCENKYKALDVCPECKSPHIKHGYVGTERLEEELKKLLPTAKVLRMDRDTTLGKDSHDRILRDFGKGNADVLVGTQMIAKGHDFSRVTLVGIVDADLSLYCSGFMGNERTFQLITQVSGRAGRENLEGMVILQTYQPNHYVYKFARAYDYHGFYDKESNSREVTKYPPFSRFIRILVSAEDESKAVLALKGAWNKICELAKNEKEAFYYYGKMFAPIKRIKNKFRYQIVLRLDQSRKDIEKQIYKICDSFKSNNVFFDIEINPNSLN